ncbi:tir-containing protein [Chrysochromulina tobinii]|uniref:Tir-containing protein n=1 Tax=Chrysochromulina tobinii TaxID=1460289 RepID=A0A0M0J9S8_9EUKA|nr:tir-containing protein [Chrysochromulina tobinii]|eukprot:KOO23359.1 tir-containing protein [Chrysochromulina sp. CCMP291]
MNDPLLRRSTTASCCTLLTHLARTDAGAKALKALIDARAVCAVRMVVATSHARAAAMRKGGLMTAVRPWLKALHSMAPAEREATLGLVSDFAAARDVSTETHVLPLVPLIVPMVQSVISGGVSARDASAVAAVKLLVSLSTEQAGLRAVHGAGVLPLLLPLMRAGSAAGEGAYMSEGGALLKRALADAEARPAGVRVVEAVVGMLPAAEGAGFDPFDAAEARFASELLITFVSHQAVAMCEAGVLPRLAKAASEDAFVAPRRLSQLAVEMLASLLQQRPTSNELTPSITRLLVRSADGATAPHAARVALLKDALPALSKEVRRNMAEACIGVLGLRNAPDELQEAAARRLLDEPDRTLRADVLPRWCAALQAEDADASSRTARVLARVEAAEVDAVPSALQCVITALAEAAPAVASDLASVVHAIAGARSQAGYRLLLDGGAVQALLRQLPHEDSSVKVAEALAKLAQTDDGQDELIRAKAAPQLLAAALEAAEDAAAADAIRALAHLAVHADGRAQLSKLAELALKGERALRLLAIAIATSSVCARAVAEPAMRMIEPALASRRPPSTAMLKLLHSVVTSGELKQGEQMANDAGTEAITSAIEGEDPYGIALHYLVDLIAKVDEVRSKVLRLNLLERILLRTLDADSRPQRYQAINLVMVLSRSEDGAAAVVRVEGVVARLARLATDQRDSGQASHADEQLATLLSKLADAATAQAARNVAADERFEPLLRLKPESKALVALVRSDKGRARARRALAHVLATNVGREAECKLLFGLLKPCYEEFRSESEDVGKRLVYLVQRDGVEPIDRVRLLDHIINHPDAAKLKQQLVAAKTFLPALVKDLDEDNVETVSTALLWLNAFPGVAGAIVPLLAAQVVHRTMATFQKPGRDRQCDDAATQLLESLLGTANRESSQTYRSVVEGILSHAARPLLVEELPRRDASRRLVRALVQKIERGASADFRTVASAFCESAGFRQLVAELAKGSHASCAITADDKSGRVAVDVAAASLSEILSAADSAGGDERRRVADAVVALGAVPMLQAQVMDDPLLRRSTTASCCTLLTHLARTDAGAKALKALIDARAVCAVRMVVATSHARAAAMRKGGLMTAVRPWLKALHSMAPAEREATLGLVSDFAAARDVSTETHVLPLVPLIVPMVQSVISGGVSARDASAVAAVKLLVSLSTEQAGLRAVHGAGVLPLLLPLMRAGSAAGEGAYMSEGGALLKRALADAEAHPAGVRVAEAVVGMLPAVEGAGFDPFDAAEARFALRVLEPIVPVQASDAASAMPSLVAVREAGGIARTLAAMRGDEWALTRSLVASAASRVSGLLNDPDGLAVAHDLGALRTLVNALEQCPDVRIFDFLRPLQSFVLAPVHAYRDAILDAGLLPRLAGFLKPGPSHPGFRISSTMVQLLASYGAPAHREAVRSSDALAAILHWRASGRLASNDTTTTISRSTMVSRSSNLVGWFAKCPAAHSILRRAIEELGEDAGGKDEAALKLLTYASAMPEGAAVTVDEGVVPALIKLLESGARSARHAEAAQCLQVLTRMLPKRTAPAAPVCRMKAREALDKREASALGYCCARSLGCLAETASKARSAIRILVARIFEEADGGREITAILTLNLLAVACESPDGARVAFKAGVVAEAVQALSGARDTQLRASALKTLTSVAENSEAARASMRDGNLIDTLVRLLHRSWAVPSAVDAVVMAGKSSAESSHVAANATPRSAFKYSAYLSHDSARDELKRDNVERVGAVKAALAKAGLVPCLVDAERDANDVIRQMEEGIAQSACVIVFLTESYMKKAAGLGSKGDDDNARFEFSQACSPSKGVAKIIPVVMEPQCLAQTSWQPLFLGKLGGKEFIDLARDNDEASGEKHFDDGVSSLISSIKAMPGSLVGGGAATAAQVGSSSTVNEAPADAADDMDRDIEVGKLALALLHTLSRGDVLRQAIQAAKPLDALQYIIEHDAAQRADALLIVSNVYSEVLSQSVGKGHGAAMVQHERVRRLLHDSRIEDELAPRLVEGVRILVSSRIVFEIVVDGSGPSYARIAATAVRNLAAESVLRQRLVHKGVGNSLARMLIEGPLAPHPTSDADLVLAAEALQRCALAITGAAEETDRIRKRLVADGAEDALTSAAELHENEDADTESVQRRRQAAKYALDALQGKLDVQTLPGTGHAQRTLKRQLSTLGTDYSKWDDHQLLSIPRYNTFISHKRSSAQDFARGLHSLIVHHGHSCFIDVENLESLSDLPMVVAGCDVFILVLSDGVFESEFCMQELASAVNAGVEIVLITKEGSRWPNQNGDMVEVFPPPELIKTLEPPECRDAFERRAITHSNEYYAAFSHNLMQTVDKMIKEHRHQYRQGNSPPEGQDTPDRLVLTQRRQLLLARSQSANRRKGSSDTAAVAIVESAVTSPVSLVDAKRLEEAINDLGDDPKLDPRVVAAAKQKLEHARAQSKYTLEEKLAAALERTACEFQFLRAKVLLERDDMFAPKHKSVQEDPELYKMLYLKSAECCQHMFREKVLAVSHRWDRLEEPDPSGAQMKAIKRILRTNPQYEYVWLDYSCAPQGERTPQEKEIFSLTLENMDFLFLGASVLILLDMSYMSRFWTQFEAWMAFQEVDSNGVLRCASEDNRRCMIECIHNANKYTKLQLIEMWSNKTPEEAYNILKSEDVSVTNTKDKELQLPRIQTFKESVQKTWRAAVENGEILSPSRRPRFKSDTETALGEPASPSVKGVLASPQLAPSPSFSTVRFEADSSTEQGVMLIKSV